MRYLLTLAVGPIQSFVAASRKTRDLYASSWILSELSKAMARHLWRAGATLIFPSPPEEDDLDPGSDFAVVNKILADVETESPSELANAAKDAARVHRIAELTDFGNIPFGYDAVRLAAHLESQFEFYSAWTPLLSDEDYVPARRRVEELLASRKLLNAFSKHTGHAGVVKSTLDGVRETVITSRGKTTRHLVRVRENEELDGPGFLKRFVKAPDTRFESTTSVAGLPYLLKVRAMAVDNPEIGAAVGSFLQVLNREGLNSEDPAYLFDIESRALFESSPDADPISPVRDELHRLCGQPDAPYYAILVADGDSMGERIGSLALPEHCKLSVGLAAFAQAVSHGLKAMDAMPVFSGGDDVLAILPLHRALEAVRFVFESFVTNAGPPFTLSAGLAIVHALEPLDEALELARAAEKDAKGVKDKAGLSVTVQPRSGAPVTVTGKWDSLLQRLSEIVDAYVEETLSFGFAHELRTLLAKVPDDLELDPRLRDLALALAKRKQQGVEGRPKNAAVKQITDLKPDATETWREALTNLMLAMFVARKMAKARRDATWAPEEGSPEPQPEPGAEAAIL